MLPRERRGSEKFTQIYGNEEFIDVLDTLGQAGTAEVAKIVGCGEKNAYRRLQDFKEVGRVESRSINNTKLWELPDGPDAVNPDDPFWDTDEMFPSGSG